MIVTVKPSSSYMTTVKSATHLGQEQVCRRVGSWKSQWADVISGAGLGGPGVRLMVESCQTRSGSTVEGGEA